MLCLSRGPALAIAAALIMVAGCSDTPATAPVEPPAGPGNPENISLVILQLTPEAGGTAMISLEEDPDGSQHPLPDLPSIDTLVLRRGVTYNGIVTLLDDLDLTHVLSITNEVLAEANFHRFLYGLTCGGVTVPTASLNRDTQDPSQPLGSSFQVIVSATAATGAPCALNLQLHHFQTGKGDGSGSNFAADLAIDLPVLIQP